MNWIVRSTKRFVRLKYIKHLLILASTVTGCIFISAFAFLVSISTGILSSAVGIKICAINAVVEKYKKRK